MCKFFSIQRNSEARPGWFAGLAVAATGCGMDGEILPRIFEPILILQESSQGTVLRLNNAQAGVKIESAVGHGSTFRVYLPATAKPLLAEKFVGKEDVMQTGKETILLVEDDGAVRQVMGLILQHLGYNVLEAASGPAALRLWRQQTTKPDLLLTDMVMPEGMNGLELAHALRREQPALKVLIVSGYSPDLVQKGMPLPETVGFLSKPVDTTTLSRKLRECFDRN